MDRYPRMLLPYILPEDPHLLSCMMIKETQQDQNFSYAASRCAIVRKSGGAFLQGRPVSRLCAESSSNKIDIFNSLVGMSIIRPC